MYPRRVWLYMVKQKGYPIHIGMPSVIQKIIRAFRPYLNVFAIRVGGVYFTNFGTASTTERAMWTKPVPRKGSKYIFLLFKYSLKLYTVHTGRITIFFGRLTDRQTQTDRQTDRQTKPINPSLRMHSRRVIKNHINGCTYPHTMFV